MDFAQRDALIANFRRQVYETVGLTLFPHQADWQLASEGWTLTDEPPWPGDHFVHVLTPIAMLPPDHDLVQRRTVNDIPCAVTRRKVIPRAGGAAHVLADLAAYKSGKSYSTAAWMTGFAIVPDAKIHIIGLEYATAEPEFTYLAELLLSERGMNLRAAVFQNDKRAGRMRIKLTTGAEFEVKSWERKEGLKGKKILAYVYAEAYQLPGLECFTTLSQNLRELRGFALFPTTPDRPWVSIFHDYGHGQDTEWHCTCNVDAVENPHTFDQRARDRDDPAKGGIMTKERFAIAWQGKLGTFVGRVYDVNRGDPSRLFTPATHAYLWKKAVREGVPACA